MWLSSLLLALLPASPLAELNLPASSLPQLKYAFTSFASAVPDEASAFCVKFLGAHPLNRSMFLAHRDASAANVTGVRFMYGGGEKSHDLYFISDPTKPAGALNATAFASHLHSVHRFDVQETWDWFMDWHLCLLVDDLDLILARLLRDGVPLVSRSSYSFYVELPHGITLQLLGSKMTLAWSETFNFCRFTSIPPTTGPQPLALAPLPTEMPPLPELAPGHHSYFSTQPDAAQQAVLRFLGGAPYNMTTVWRDSHRYSDGRCALLAWVQLPEYQVHFVQQYRKAQGPKSVAEVEAYLEQLHSMKEQDSFFDNRIGFSVPSLAPFEDTLRRAAQPFLKTNSSMAASLFLRLPGGVIVELQQSHD